MSFADNYLRKHKSLVPHIQEPPQGLLRYIVVIPAYLEEKLELTLNSLLTTKRSIGIREVIVVVNYSEADNNENKNKNIELFHRLKTWCQEKSTNSLTFHAILASELPKKHAGVGLARKIGMDEALYRFSQNNNSEGIILSLDADTIVDGNYFVSLEQEDTKHVNAGGFIYQFEHPISGKDFSCFTYEAMVMYELHLRYCKHALDYTGFPYSNYTLGSCFAVRAEYYAEQGGMNRRQAGEDFYFLNKLFPHMEFISIKNSCVYPSSRVSTRVPFGTGPAIADIIMNQGNYESYSMDSFTTLKHFFSSIPNLYLNKKNEVELIWKSFPELLRKFIHHEVFIEKLDEIRKNTTTLESFTKRFYQWFDAFSIVKFLNFSHNNGNSKLPVQEAIVSFFELAGVESNCKTIRDQLAFFRKLDRSGKNLKGFAS